MTYVEGGTLTVNYRVTITKNLLKAAMSAGAGAVVGVVASALTIKLGWAGIAISTVAGVITSLIMSYVSDTKMKNLKDKTFLGKISCLILGGRTKVSINSKIGR